MGQFGGIPVDDGQAKMNRFGGIPDSPAATKLPTAKERPPVHYAFDPSIAAARTGLSGAAADLAERFNRQRLNLQSGLTFGGAEELRAGMQALPEAAMNWFRGGDFDYSKRYSTLHQQLESAKELRRAQNPIASRVEEATGSVAGALGLGQAGLTLAGRQAPGVITQVAPKVVPKITPYVTAGTEGAIYGGTQGALEAKPGERLAGAGKGARLGAAAGIVSQAVPSALSALDDVFAKRVPVSTGVTSEQLGDFGSRLYQRAEQEGVRYRPHAVQNLQVETRAAAGRIDPHGRPTTASIARDILKMDPKQSMSFGTFHDLQKRIGRALRDSKVSNEDKHFLEQMRDATDRFAKNVNPAKDVTGGDPARAYAFKKAADQVWVKHVKMGFLEDLEELALIKGRGHLTQSGVANAVKQLSQAEAKKIIAGKPSAPWSKSEAEMIKKMASGDTSAGTTKLLSRFALRGPVATAAGSVAGGQLLGWLTSQLGVPQVVAHALPIAAGSIAAQKADQNALDALEALRQGVAGVRPTPRPAPPPVPATQVAPIAALETERRNRNLGFGGPR